MDRKLKEREFKIRREQEEKSKVDRQREKEIMALKSGIIGMKEGPSPPSELKSEPELDDLIQQEDAILSKIMKEGDDEPARGLSRTRSSQQLEDAPSDEEQKDTEEEIVQEVQRETEEKMAQLQAEDFFTKHFDEE